MLVVGGIKPGFDDLQPLDASGCDTSAKFGQGLGLFSLNNHTWTTAYDPRIGATPYLIHPSISKVIGGNASGGATLQTPIAGFTENSLGTLLGARPEPNNSTLPSIAPASSSAAPKHQSLATDAKVGIAIGVLAGVGMILGALLFLYPTRRRKQRRPWPPSISTPILTDPPPQLRYYTELNAMHQPVELRGSQHDDMYANRFVAHELMGEGGFETRLASKSLERIKQIEIHEMEAWSPVSARSGPEAPMSTQEP